jgi:malate dehydrogenase (oxaloacetate-decarboxylating)(NADP+)
MPTGNPILKTKTGGDPLKYHQFPKPGKLEIVATKPMDTQADLSLAYSPGVAQVCTQIEQEMQDIYSYTAKANLVAVISNGTAVLGLGNIGAAASKPVMEGKAVLFKKFANVDCFDIEVDEQDPDKFIETVKRLEPTFGGINLEDIKAPECFRIEQELQAQMQIPVFHDDQHGTAIILTAAFINSMHITGKNPEDVKVVCSGAGAAGLSCMKMLTRVGVKKENIFIINRSGVVHKGRENLNEYLVEFAQETDAVETLDQAIEGADVFVGVSAAGVLTKEMVAKMAPSPVIFAMANPTPEIMPEDALEVRPDAIVGTGRSDYPNQVNNVLCFPYIFRGALDVQATKVNEEMKMACAQALAELARLPIDPSLEKAYGGAKLKFGKEYVIPKPFDPRLMSYLAPRVAKAAMDTGVARLEIEDLKAYEEALIGATDQSVSLMQGIYNQAMGSGKKIVFPEGEHTKILRAAQQLIDQDIAHPILIGKESIMLENIEQLGLRLKNGENCTFVDPETYPKMDEYAEDVYSQRKREGVTREEADIIMQRRWASLGAMMVKRGEADGMVAGLSGKFNKFLHQAQQVLGKKEGVDNVYAMQVIMRGQKVYFITDTHVNAGELSSQNLAEMSLLASDMVKKLNIEPRVALLSHSNFGSDQNERSAKVRDALELVRKQNPDLVIEGEMQADSALNMEILGMTMPDSKLKEYANILVMPNIDAANISYNMLQVTEGSQRLGPILLGMRKPVHILSNYSTVRDIVNMSALAVVESNI